MSEFVYVNTPLSLSVLVPINAVAVTCVTWCSWRSVLLPIVDPCGCAGDEILLLARFELVLYCVRRTRLRCSSVWLAVKVRQKLDKSVCSMFTLLLPDGFASVACRSNGKVTLHDIHIIFISWDGLSYKKLERHSIFYSSEVFDGAPYTSFLGAFAKVRKATISFLMCVRPHGMARLLLDGFSWNLIFEYFSKIFGDSSSFIKIW